MKLMSYSLSLYSFCIICNIIFPSFFFALWSDYPPFILLIAVLSSCTFIMSFIINKCVDKTKWMFFGDIILAILVTSILTAEILFQNFNLSLYLWCALFLNSCIPVFFILPISKIILFFKVNLFKR